VSDLNKREICVVPLKDVGVWIGGGTPSKAIPAYWENGTIPWVSPKDMKVAHIHSTEDSITEKAVKESATNLLPAGAVLVVTRSGILRHTFPVAVTDVPVTVNQDLKALVPQSEIDPEYVAFALRAFSREILNQCSKQGTTVNSIETQELLRFQIPLFSFNEQSRIVAEIEKQFSRLDEAVANLKRVKANLKRYKAAVLKAAVEGKLTEEWRRQHPDVEPADKLLERILAERRKGAGKGKYKEPIAPETANLPKLPAGWVWASVEQVGQSTTGFTPPTGNTEFFGGDIPFFKPTDLDAGYNTIRPREWLTASGADRGRLLPAKSILVTCIGATIGKTGFARVPCATNQQINALTLIERYTMPEYLFWFFVSPEGQRQIIENSSATTLPILNKSKFEALAAPVPPLAEQHQIVAEVERRLSIVAGAEAQVDANLRRAERLRQSILKQAFSGQLVPQDANDEPASVLLERIRAERHKETDKVVALPRRQRPPAPKAGALPTEPLPLVAEAPAPYGATIPDRILAAMQPGRQYSRADLADPLGLSTGQWNAAIQELKRSGQVQQVGEKRGARYFREE
jgi:type I restriction enzyme S subunit